MEPGLSMQILLHYISELFFLFSLPAMEDAKAVKYQACIMGIPWAGGMARIQGYVQSRKKKKRKLRKKEAWRRGWMRRRRGRDQTYIFSFVVLFFQVMA